MPYWSVKFVDIRRYAIRQTFAANMCWLCVIAYALRWTKPPTTPQGAARCLGWKKPAGHFHGESEGGIKLFQIIGRLAASFREHNDVLEIIYHILGLGFEGRYSVRPDGRKQLDDIRQQLLTQLVQRRDPITPTLSPGFAGAVSGRMRRMRRVPVWLSAGIALLVMLTLFGLYSHRMNLATETVQQRIDAIGKIYRRHPFQCINCG